MPLSVESVGGKQILAHRWELELIFMKLAEEELDECCREGRRCEMVPGWLDGMLSDLQKSLARHHREVKAA